MVESEYAKAVFDLAKEEDKIEVFTNCFNAVIDTKTKEFTDILVSPFIHKEEKKRIVDKVYHSLDETFLHFLYVLIDHNRFDKVNDIYREYEKLVLKDNNILRVKLISANEIKSKRLKEFKETLENKYPNMKIEIINEINPNLIGGVQIITDDASIDASVRGTLDKIRGSL